MEQMQNDSVVGGKDKPISQRTLRHLFELVIKKCAGGITQEDVVLQRLALGTMEDSDEPDITDEWIDIEYVRVCEGDERVGAGLRHKSRLIAGITKTERSVIVGTADGYELNSAHYLLKEYQSGAKVVRKTACTAQPLKFDDNFDVMGLIMLEGPNRLHRHELPEFAGLSQQHYKEQAVNSEEITMLIGLLSTANVVH